jgi:DNA polymerase III subunit gamma/tau
MLDEQLTLKLRPKTFSEMVGQERLTKKLTDLFTQSRPQAIALTGARGCGKTTIARIIALSVQCKHQDSFGNPCKLCRKKKSSFDIIEINASDVTGIDALREIVKGSDYAPKPGSRRRVYILDELHRASEAAQNLLLKFVEDAPTTTLWIICTTAPDAIIPTLIDRCLQYPVIGLTSDGVRKLVRWAFKKEKSDKPKDALIDQLNERGVNRPRAVIMAVQKYLTGESPEEAAASAHTDLDTYRICRHCIKGDWEAAREELQKAVPEDAFTLRSHLSKYLQTVLLESQEISSRTKVVANALHALASLAKMEYGLQLSATIATVYNLCASFSKYRR